MKKTTNSPKQEDGSVIAAILFVTAFLITIVFSMIVLSNANLSRARARVLLLQAQYAAESGADAAIASLNNGNETYTGSGGEIQVLNNNLYKSTFSVTVSNGANTKERVITATGKVYSPKSATQARHSRTIEVIAQRTSSTASSGMVSRNIISVDSSVKELNGKDIYANGYITLNKNTTDLIAESITIADKNTGASNCSIGGTGNLLKPASFTTPGQTKTKITVAYNNCISPPGNLSNTNFDVLANQNTISKVRSTYIPWSEYMDSSYQNAPGGCSDWTIGTFPRKIPSTGNLKKTHYPDNGSGVTASCGSSGSLNLDTGQYNILDNVHIRADLCATSACNPTFYNPDAGADGIKYVFVEGAINFDSVQTAPGSGPIVFISYGADPAAKAAVCPLGGSIYFGNAGNTTAPALYLLALNGVCFDKTKFGASPALGGLSGKNLYISTNSGTPFDLALDKTFPVDKIPIDLSWRAVRYKRL
jgi:hypothetical protein